VGGAPKGTPRELTQGGWTGKSHALKQGTPSQGKSRPEKNTKHHTKTKTKVKKKKTMKKSGTIPEITKDQNQMENLWQF